ncbi:MAG TPA: diguanylate cyclase [Micromonosporaceae bacterium]|nr:diguanylate cyclase [Micromonosporaceae bacterium]
MSAPRPVPHLGYGLALVLVALSAALGSAATAAPSPAPAAANPGGLGLRLLEAPQSARDDPRAQMYIVDHLAPAAIIQRKIEVANTTRSPVAVMLYPSAAGIADGSFLGAAGLTANDLSTWTSIRPGSMTVPAGGRVTATVTIALPGDAAPGEQYGVVWAEARAAATGGGVVQVSRVGIRLYLSVGPGGAPRSDFTINTLTAARSAEGLPTIVASVQNTGGRALDMTGTLRLSDGPGGLSAGPFPAKLGVTLPIGATEPVTIALDPQLPNGPWQAEITLRSGLVERTARATITFPMVGAAAPVPATAVQPRWLYPAVGIAILILVVAVTSVLVVLWRRSQRRGRHVAMPATRERATATGSPDRRRGTREPTPRLGQQPVTVSDILDASPAPQPALASAQDPLTDLANRSLFVAETQFAIDTRDGDRLCLMLLNLDQYHTINDSLGRDAGDAVLVGIAERLRRAVRPQDLVARLDGDEFAVLFEDVGRADVDAIAHRMLQTVGEPMSAGGHQVRVFASVGVAQREPSDDARRLMEHARTALADARADTAARYAWYIEAAEPTPPT